MPLQLGSVSFFDEKVSHFGTANDSAEERLQTMSRATSGCSTPKSMDGDRCNMRSHSSEKAVHRILPVQYQREAAQTLQQYSLLEEYNKRAPAGFTLKA